MPFFEISLETANKFYAWGWRASIAGAVITAVGVILLMYGTRVRDRDTASQLSRANLLTAQQAADLRQAEQTISRQNAEIETLKPWQLSAEQQKKLMEELRSFSAGKIAFFHRVMDGEGRDFAEQLAAIFKSAGWSISGIGGSSLNDLPGRVTVAIDAASSSADFLKTADRLCDALTRAGIPCGGDLKPNTLGGLSCESHVIAVARTADRIPACAHRYLHLRRCAHR